MIIVGIDEVGRGCWAGPLVAGAVVLRANISGLRDSKKLSTAQRSVLSKQIMNEASAVGLGWVWPEDIDKYGITWSVKTAMERAVEAIATPYDEIVIDGNYNFLSDHPNTRSLIRADDTVPAVSAASIVAKVARDTYMITVAHQEFPAYHFASHVGYGTAAHSAALREFGVTPLHRRSYKPIRALLEGST